jgi:hypothetical protein
MKVLPNRPERSIEPLPENLFREPVDCLYADHFRLRAICDQLERLALDEVRGSVCKVARACIDYLERDLPLHIADEEDLLPLLRSRCGPGDDVDEAFAVLHASTRASWCCGRSCCRICTKSPPDRLPAACRDGQRVAPCRAEAGRWSIRRRRS